MRIAPNTDWFVVLPDIEIDFDMRHVLELAGANSFRYPSGRPWIIGNLAPRDLTVSVSGTQAYALIGDAPSVSNPQLARSNRRALTAPGSFFSICRSHNDTLIRGCISGVKRVFYASIRGATIASNRSDILASLRGSSFNVRAIASKLIYPAGPSHLESMSVWEGVKATRETHWLVISDEGDSREEPYWSYPETQVPLRQGAVHLYEKLDEAIRLRVHNRSVVSCDLSGGMDSTPICHLAARASPNVVAFTSGGGTGAGEDFYWADIAARNLRVKRRILNADALPLPYAEIGDASNLQLDEPFVGIPIWFRLQATADVLRAMNSEIHLAGHGGDEVLTAPAAHAFALFWKNPLQGIRAIRGYRARHRWPLLSTVSTVFNPPSHDKWLRAMAHDIRFPGDEVEEAVIWGSVASMPLWVTNHAVEMAIDEIKTTPREVKRSHASANKYSGLELLFGAGRSTRLLAQVMRGAGINLAAPLLDSAVVIACLSVADEERSDPRQYKPLMVEAMRGIVPDEVLRRSTKPSFAVDVHRGRRKYADQLLRLCNDSRLEALGLINGDLLREACLGVGAPYPQIALWRTLACEIWLRSWDR